MQEAIINFFQLIYDEFIGPIVMSIGNFINDNSYLVGDFFKILFNWLFNIGRDTPIEYFTEVSGLLFFYDLIIYILLFTSIFLVIKAIKAIFKPIFKLLNIGGDVKWHR